MSMMHHKVIKSGVGEQVFLIRINDVIALFMYFFKTFLNLSLTLSSVMFDFMTMQVTIPYVEKEWRL